MKRNQAPAMDHTVKGPTTAEEQFEIRKRREDLRARSGQDVLVDSLKTNGNVPS